MSETQMMKCIALFLTFLLITGTSFHVRSAITADYYNPKLVDGILALGAILFFWGGLWKIFGKG